jgi:hypothetical protein
VAAVVVAAEVPLAAQGRVPDSSVARPHSGALWLMLAALADVFFRLLTFSAVLSHRRMCPLDRHEEHCQIWRACIWRRKDYARAERMFREVIQRYAKRSHRIISFERLLKSSWAAPSLVRKRYAEAESQTLAGYNILLKQTSPTVSWLQSARKDLVTIYEALNQPDQAAHFRTELADTVAKR